MADDAQLSSLLTADETGLTAVLAHSMLGTVSAIRGAIDAAMASEVVGPGRDSILLIAVRRLEFLTSQLRDLAAGLPGSAVVVDLRTYLESNAAEDES
jgi:hypothetical protein